MENEYLKYLFSSISTATVTKTCISPLMRVKTLMQIQTYHNTNNYNSLFKSLQLINKNEGFRGFFKGNLANISKSIPNYCIKFPVNEFFTNKLLQNNGYNSVKKLNFNQLFQAGLFTGVIQTSVTYPIDLVRTRIMQDSKMLESEISMVKCFKDTVKKEGVMSLYKGFKPAILTTPIYIGLQLSSYQYFKNQDNLLSNPLIAGGLSGIISQTLMYPGDTVKKQLQIDGMKNKQYTGMMDCVNKIYKQYGIKGYYRGIWINMIKSVPEITLKFLIYDLVKTKLNEY